MRKLPVLLLALALVLCSAYVPDRASSASISGTDIFGQVVNETGAPFSGVEVRVVNTTKPTTSFTVVSDQNGNYTMPSNFLPGTYNVTATFVNYSANISYSNVMVKNGEAARLNFTMVEVLCKLIGKVHNGTTPITGATVTLKSMDGKVFYNGTSDAFGDYSISKIRPGIYSAYASKVGYYKSDPVALLMVRGTTNTTNFYMEEQPADLGGKVEYDGKGLNGVTVKLSSSLFTAETVTDEDGNYTFSQVPSGSYTITFSKESFLSRSLSVGLTPFEVRELDVEMEYDNANNTQTFLLGLDLAHSLMVIGLSVSIMVLIVGIYINYKVRRKPELLERDDSEKD
ncbi:Carboxypeptidase regulatory-like domain protein [anaerobic digester metagenome]